MKSKATTVDAYLKELEPDARASLAVLRGLIKKAAPGLKEHMAYGMPTYSAGETMLFGLANQKQYLALYVCNEDAVVKHQKELGATSIGKSCIRFKTVEQLNLKAVTELLRQAQG